MGCEPEILQGVPIFSLLDKDEVGVLAGQVELRKFSPRQRIYKIGDPGGRAYIMVSGRVRVSTVDEDQQEVQVSEADAGDFFGFASMIDASPHQTSATAVDDVVCIEVDRHDIAVLIERKPHAGMDIFTVLGRHFHASQKLIRDRAMRNPNEIIEKEASFGERIADSVAQFGGSWSFIIAFAAVLVVYTGINILLGKSAWDPYPYILLNLFLSMLAAIQAPVIMMSQNRQDAKDRLRGELDFDVNRRAESEIKGLSRKLHSLEEKLGDIEDLLRGNANGSGPSPAPKA